MLEHITNLPPPTPPAPPPLPPLQFTNRVPASASPSPSATPTALSTRACASTTSAGGTMPCPRCSNARCRAACNTPQRTTLQQRGWHKHAGSARHAAAHDDLVYAIDVETQTFDILGVKEHASFMKEIQTPRSESLSYVFSNHVSSMGALRERNEDDVSNTSTASLLPHPCPVQHALAHTHFLSIEIIYVLII